MLEVSSPPVIRLSGQLGAPGDLDGRALVLEAAGLGESGVLTVVGPRRIELWFEDGHPTYGRADGLVGLDGRLERDLAAERFAEAERRASFGRGLVAELTGVGAPPDRVRDSLRALVLDVLQLLLDAAGEYRFEARTHPYTGWAWIDLAGSGAPGGPTLVLVDGGAA